MRNISNYEEVSRRKKDTYRVPSSLSPQLKMTLPAFFLFHGICPISSTAIVTVDKEAICPSNRYRHS
jgi:hypothetical protein